MFARIVDFETTGTPEDESPEVIEMAYYDVHIEDREIAADRCYQSLCRPRLPIPAVARAVHHISDNDVQQAPEARDLWDEFLGARYQGDALPAYLVAHNAKFEQHFTPDVGIPWICTYRVARIVWPDAPGHSNQVLRYWLALPCDDERAQPPHRALPDAYVTAWLFIELLKHKTPDEMVVISRYPALIKTMNFGKHKGTTFEAAPIDYLEWIRDKSDLNEDTKFSAHYWIQKRTR